VQSHQRNPGSYSIGPVAESGSSTCTAAGAASKPAVTWAETLKFCGLSSANNTGCNSGDTCTPSTSAQHCLLLDGASASCPSGYAAKGGPWYTGVNDTRTCAACGCNVTTAPACGARTVGVEKNGSCNATNPPTKPTNMRQCAPIDYPVFTLRGSPVAGQCSAFSAVSGTASPTGGRTLCCK